MSTLWEKNSGHGLIDLRGASAARYGFGYVSTLYGSVSLRLKCVRFFCCRVNSGLVFCFCKGPQREVVKRPALEQAKNDSQSGA